MFILDGVALYGAGDLAQAAQCEFALLRGYDVKLGRVDKAQQVVDPMFERTLSLGDAHERRYLDQLVEKYGRQGVLEFPGQGVFTAAGLAERNQQTLAAMRAGTDVIYQGSFYDGRFNGRSDFLVKGDDGRYTVIDTKLARQARVTALLQVSGYADQLDRSGIPAGEHAQLLLGNGDLVSYRLSDLLPVYRDRRLRLELVLDEHAAEFDPVAWGDPRYSACGRCEVCAAEVDRTRDLLTVAGLSTTQRVALHHLGIRTIDQLAEQVGAEHPDGVNQGSWQRLTNQARMQVAQNPPSGPPGPVTAEVVQTAPLEALPAPDPGDIFFDFEGDPLWAESGSTEWGLEYLFGVIEAPVGNTPPVFRPFWAHNRAQEATALQEFLAYLAERRARFPNMHVYHYAPYEKSALLRLAVRHHFGEDQVDDLLREGVLVDLYATVRGAIMISQPSYSIKKLEPLYMTAARAGEVTTAGDSIDVYFRYTNESLAGNPQAAQLLLDEIAEYNRYDCESTLGLRDWLLAKAAEEGLVPRGVTGTEPDELRPPTAEQVRSDNVVQRLLDLVPDRNRTADDQALAFVAAAVGYHQREAKPFWWGHFARLVQPTDEWPDRRDIFLAERGVVVAGNWFKTGKQKKLRRILRLRGQLEEGSTLSAGSKVYAVYEPPLADGLDLSGTGFRATNSSVTVTAVDEDPDGTDVVTVEEMTPGTFPPFDHLPMALSPSAPPFTTSIQLALLGLAEQIAGTAPLLPAQPGLDILRLLPPRLTGASGLTPRGDGGDGYISAITDSLLRLQDSYVAVQGPPGTGKTHVGARVIAALVAQGWRIGVVAQSHAVVENMLAGVVKAGVDPALVGKEHKSSVELTWTSLPTSRYAEFLGEHEQSGCVVGGTAWTFTNHKQVPAGSLDLVVIDEAGQFALANTLAVSTAAPRLLLLGDPQQLPQVSQGTHPEPVDQSALGWLAHGHAALPAERGYFLEKTWRMHPAVCAPVSELAYDGQLHSEESHTAVRHLDGMAPGISVVRLDHHGNSVMSLEEADAIVPLVQKLLGLAWTDPGAGSTEPRPLAQEDVLVVAPYNAQVSTIRRALQAAGLPGVDVGTVDKFQGRQAPVVLVSMTASAVEDVPRGMGFLLSRNRLNVAVSRAQWAAIIVRSESLTDYLPTTPENLAELGAFIGLCDAAG